MVFRLSIALLAALVIAGVVAPDAFGAWAQRMQAATLGGAGWLYLAIVFCVLAFLIYLAFGRVGLLRTGGQDATPEFSRGSWFAMIFSAGMGIGQVFRGLPSRYHTWALRPRGSNLGVRRQREPACAMHSSTGVCTPGPFTR